MSRWLDHAERLVVFVAFADVLLKSIFSTLGWPEVGGVSAALFFVTANRVLIGVMALKAPKPQTTTGAMIDTAVLTAKVNGLVSDMNAIKVAVGFKQALGAKVEAK